LCLFDTVDVAILVIQDVLKDFPGGVVFGVTTYLDTCVISLNSIDLPPENWSR
jgi:hypothetical protein